MLKYLQNNVNSASYLQLMNYYIFYFGLWACLKSAEFKGLMFGDFIKTVTITPHHPQANGQIADLVEATLVAMKKVIGKTVQ